jgi:lipoprotein-releasing system permease protein
MFELSVACKYLIPKRKQLSVTLIALMSMSVISLVVWLILVFLSVTEGMERNWLKKLTDLNAPIKIVPTQDYYSSYYYNIDSVCSESNYQFKTIGEKAISSLSDPYNPDEDAEIPYHFNERHTRSDGTFIDPVKEAYTILQNFTEKKQIISFQDFEMSGALLKLQLLRNNSPLFSKKGAETINFISQVSYIASMPSDNPFLSSLVLSPSNEDVTHLLHLCSQDLDENRTEGAPQIRNIQQNDKQQKMSAIFEHTTIDRCKSSHPFWNIPKEIIADGSTFKGYIYKKNEIITQAVITNHQHDTTNSQLAETVTFHKCNGQLIVKNAKESRNLPLSTPIFSEEILDFETKPLLFADNEASHEPFIHVKTTLQGNTLTGIIPWQALDIVHCSVATSFESQPKHSPIWLHSWKNADHHLFYKLPTQKKNVYGVLLPKSFRDHGVMIGDTGFLSYNTSTSSSFQEQRLQIFVSGFYDPGIMSVGNKCILAPKEVTRAINSSLSTQTFDKIALNGIQVWLNDVEKAEAIKKDLQKAFEEHQIGSYFSIASYKDYDFAKELLQQFQSDKYLFSLIAIIIITVACCNIISLLVLLVNDKKKEIGIMLSMGASNKSIAFIFGSCGVFMGSIGCALGCLGAYFTMHHIDSLVSLLSTMQGHAAFSSSFYGSSLPSTLSLHAVYFVIIATPLLALSAGLIPAIKACLLKPSTILRSE